MLVIRSAFNNLDPRRTVSSISCLAAAAVFCLVMGHAMATAQVSNFQARVTRVTSGVTYYRGSLPSALRLGEILQPRDVIDTGRSGRVVIALDDGSQVTIFPWSRVELKDFQGGGSWRDLLDVTVGRVRATINHRVKRPNPYRVYSPVASIAVRGTDFLVIVEPNGETRVVVYEGLVEVSSLVKPQQPILVQPGRNIIVRPDGDISLVMAAPRGELNEIRSLRSGVNSFTNLNSAYFSHEENYTDLRPSRFTAFSDSHLDSLQNPAYATEFRQSSGRFYLIPSFSPKIETIFESGNRDIQAESINSFNYTLSPQLSYFAPLGSRIAVGGGMAVTKTDIRGSDTEIYPGLPDGGRFHVHSDGTARFTTTNMSLVAARLFGQEERTSIGVKLDYVMDRSSYSFDYNVAPNILSIHEEDKARGRRIGLSVGVTQDFGGGKKLGIYYGHSAGSVRNRFTETERWEEPYYHNVYDAFYTRPNHSSKAGILFRGSVTRRLFYGVESSILSERSRDENRYAIVNRRAKRALLGAGIGYALRSRTVLSLDLSAGRAWENFRSKFLPTDAVVIGNVSDGAYGGNRPSFWSLHGGGQTDLWRNFFVGGAMLIVRERNLSRSGTIGGNGDVYQSSYSEKYTLSNFSAGWRMTPGWIVQYVYFTSYGRSSPSHSLMFRYEFGGKGEK